MALHSSTLAWKIPWTEEPGRLQSRGSLSRIRLSDFTFTFHFHALEKAVATHSSVFAWRIPGTGELGGLLPMGSHRVGHDWSDLAAAAARHKAHVKEQKLREVNTCEENEWQGWAEGAKEIVLTFVMSLWVKWNYVGTQLSKWTGLSSQGVHCLSLLESPALVQIIYIEQV